jgi:RND family efflux transporter MFP subunit
MNNRLAAALAALALSGGSAACSGEHTPKAAAPPPPRIVRVDRARSVTRGVGEEVVGTVRARKTAAISAVVMGKVALLTVDLGSRVKAGEIVARISASEIDAKRDQAHAVYERRKVDLARAKKLAEEGALAPAVYDAALTEFQVAGAQEAEAIAMADHTVLRAPFAGVVTSKVANVGDTAMPGQPVIEVEDPSALRLEATLPEAEARTLAQGQSVPVRIDAVGEDLAGTVAEISPTADPASRTVLAKVDLPSDPRVHSGLFGRLLLAASREAQTVVVPVTAIARRGQLESVFVVERGFARLRLVRTGRERDGAIEVVSGLSDGEAVASSDVGTLLDEQPVEVTP